MWKLFENEKPPSGVPVLLSDGPGEYVVAMLDMDNIEWLLPNDGMFSVYGEFFIHDPKYWRFIDGPEINNNDA